MGALFTLSPPLSMMISGATLVPTRGPGAVTLAVAAYAVAITATMGIVGLAATLVYGVIPLVG